MKIIKVILHRYNRVFLSDIETLELTPENSLSIILSMNGTGKSSLLSQLSPLPGNITKDFNEGGYKYIEVEHDNSLFKLTSGVNGTKKHSFIKDDIEYNEGGTISVQNELVKHYFKLTNHIHNVTLGVNKFTTMSSNERKKWITSISNIDYTFPIKVFNSLKSRHRDIMGGIKLTQAEIVKSEALVMSEVEINNLKYEISLIKDMIEHLLTLYSNKTVNVNIEEVVNNINKATILANKLISDNVGICETNTNTLKEELSVLKERITHITDKINLTNTDIDKLEKVNNDNLDTSLLQEEVLKLEKDIKEIIDTMYVEIDIDNIKNTYTRFKNSYTNGISILSELLEHNNVNSDRENYTALQNTLLSHSRQLDIRNNRLKLLSDELGKIDKLNTSDNEVTCPVCDHSWVNGYNPADRDKIIDEQEKLTLEVVNFEDLISKVNSEINDIDNKYIVIKKLKNITSETPEVWRYLLSNHNIHNDDNYKLYNKFEQVNLDFNHWYEATILKVKKDELIKAIESNNISNKIKEELKNQDISKLHKQLEQLIVDKHNTSDDIKLKQELIDNKVKVDKLVDFIKKQITLYYNSLKDSKEVLRDTYLKKAINELKSELITLEEKLTTSDTIMKKIKDNKKLLDKYNLKEKGLKILITELSPSEGLIAESINSFLNIFLDDVNKLINTVWNYEMRILPCEVSEGNDLDYKFKVLVDNKQVIEDIGKTSSSMQEMIDLAFRIMFIKYSGLESHPLILDEFGRTFDAEHRITAYNTVDKVISSNFQQIFMVSHFESMYGRFNNADICILNTNGVDMSNINKYNTTLKLA